MEQKLANFTGMGDAVKILPNYTYDDYVSWEGKWEVINGIPYAMSPAPAPKHQWIASNLASEFRLQLKGCKACNAYLPIDYKVADDTILQPDLLVVCGDIKKKFLDFPPVLVVEILSPSTALKDRHNKMPIYQKEGVPYCLVVSPDSEQVEVFILHHKRYLLKKQGHDFSFVFHFDGGCKAEINFGEIWK